MTVNSGASTGGRDGRGRFASGNPGRLRGSRNKVTALAQQMLHDAAGRLTEVAIEQALLGDPAALKLCLGRLLPVPKDAPVQFDLLPATDDTARAVQVAASVLEAVSTGDLTPDEATRVMALLDRYTRIVELSDLEARIAGLEAAR